MRSTGLVLLASALALAACTALSNPAPRADVASAIVPGETTKADVERMAGPPVRESSAERSYPAESVYMYQDVWGQKSQLSVTYDGNGVVTSTFSEVRPDR